MDIDHVYIEYTQEFEKELNIVHGFGSVSSFIDDEAEEPTDIGSIMYNFYNMFSFKRGNDALISADAISGDEEYMISTLLYSDFEFEDGGALVTLDRIILEEQYQSAKLERMILEEFLEYCSYMMVDYVAVIASKPLNERMKSDKIVEFPQQKMYEACDFITVGGSEKHNPVMIRNLL